MASEDKLRLDMERGVRAESLLKNELLQDAFTRIEEQLLRDWKQTTTEESQRREDAWRTLKLLQNLHSGLRAVVIKGDGAKKELEQLTKIKNPSIFKR